jgi:hypothetical protein
MNDLGYPCDYKVRYATETAAKLALQSAKSRRDIKKGKWQGRHNEKRQEQRKYECPTCGFWHITSMSKEDYDQKAPRR